MQLLGGAVGVCKRRLCSAAGPRRKPFDFVATSYLSICPHVWDARRRTRGFASESSACGQRRHAACRQVQRFAEGHTGGRCGAMAVRGGSRAARDSRGARDAADILMNIVLADMPMRGTGGSALPLPGRGCCSGLPTACSLSSADSSTRGSSGRRALAWCSSSSNRGHTRSVDPSRAQHTGCPMSSPSRPSGVARGAAAVGLRHWGEDVACTRVGF